MFEVGKAYMFTLVEPSGERAFTAEVADVNGYLVKLQSGEILNTISSAFISAEPYPDEEALKSNRYARIGLSSK